MPMTVDFQTHGWCYLVSHLQVSFVSLRGSVPSLLNRFPVAAIAFDGSSGVLLSLSAKQFYKFWLIFKEKEQWWHFLGGQVMNMSNEPILTCYIILYPNLT